jgi:hypothetical protein
MTRKTDEADPNRPLIQDSSGWNDLAAVLSPKPHLSLSSFLVALNVVNFWYAREEGAVCQ